MHPFYPLYDRTVAFKLYESKEIKPLLGDECTQLGKISLDIPNMKAGDEVLVKFYFGRTMIKVTASWSKGEEKVEETKHLEYVLD